MRDVIGFAKKMKRSRARIYQLLTDGRIEGATLDEFGNWVIPDNAVLPERKRRGRKVSPANRVNIKPQTK